MADQIFDTKILEAMFAEGTKIYKSRGGGGFQRRFGFGQKLAIINVDLANAWTRPGHPFSCDADGAVEATARLLTAARQCRKKIYITYSTTAFNCNGDDPPFLWEDNGRWQEKIPLGTLDVKSDWAEIDSRLNVQPHEHVFVKKMASCFAGTPLNYLFTSRGIDTVIVTGATACACVRHTVMDAVALGYKVIVPQETIADRIPGVVLWNLFDMDAKFADVMPVDEVIAHINGIEK